MLITIFECPIVPRGSDRGIPVSYGGHARLKKTKQNEQWQSAFAELAEPFRPLDLMHECIRVDCLFVFPRPGRFKARRHPDGLIWHDVKPDRDNCDKNVLDALKPCAKNVIGALKPWWTDDTIVCDGRLIKAYAERDGAPRVVVRISSVDPAGPTEIARAMGMLDAPSLDVPLVTIKPAEKKVRRKGAIKTTPKIDSGWAAYLKGQE